MPTHCLFFFFSRHPGRKKKHFRRDYEEDNILLCRCSKRSTFPVMYYIIKGRTDVFENIRKTEAGVMGWSEIGMNLKEWIKDEQWRTLIILFMQKQLNILSLFEYPQLSDEKELALRMTFPNPHPWLLLGSSWQWRGPARGWWLCV